MAGGRFTRFSRRWLLITAATAIAVAGAIAVVIALVSGDGDGSGSLAVNAGNDSREPVVKGPATQFVIQLGDKPDGYRAFPPQTFILTPVAWAASGLFESQADGEAKAEAWGFKDGYQATLEPLGQLADVAQGKYYLRVESVLFENASGAHNAYGQIVETLKRVPGSEKQEVNGLGNESSGWKLLGEPVATTELPGAFHRFIFRRGNLLTTVQTYGVDQFMTIARAREFADVIDQKALGQRPAPTPTPGSSGTLPPAPTPTR